MFVVPAPRLIGISPVTFAVLLYSVTFTFVTVAPVSFTDAFMNRSPLTFALAIGCITVLFYCCYVDDVLVACVVCCVYCYVILSVGNYCSIVACVPVALVGGA